MEVAYDFVHASSEEIVGHEGPTYIWPSSEPFSYLFCVRNLIGLIPGFDSPTMYPMVPLGFAV